MRVYGFLPEILPRFLLAFVMLSGVTSNRIVVCQCPGLGRQLREVPAAVPVVESSRVENFDSQDIHRHSSDCNLYNENMIAYARLGFK